jgi:hypothetical protein
LWKPDDPSQESPANVPGFRFIRELMLDQHRWDQDRWDQR